MRKSTAAILFGCLVGLVVYVSVLSVALVRDLHSSGPETGYSIISNADTAEAPKMEVAATNVKSEDRAQAVKAVKHRRVRSVVHRQRIKAQNGVTLML